MKTAVVFTSAHWEHALVVLRLSGPLRQTGFHLVCGTQDGEIDTEQIPNADLVLIQRDFPKHLAAYERILFLARQASIPVILDLDDWLLELPENHPDRITHHYAAGLFPILRAALEADAVTVSTARLGDQVQRLNDSTWVLPNYIDEKLWNFTPPALNNKDPVRLVYMGGDSHIPDLQLVIPVLGTILERYAGRVTFHVVGMQSNPVLSSLPGVMVTPFMMDYAKYARFADEQRFDLAIAPLMDNTFNRCKSSIKYLEYSALGLPAIYSDIPHYTDVVSNGENGFLACSLEEWMQAIVRLIDDPELRLRMGKAAQDNVRRNWLLADHAHEWAEAYQMITATPRRQPHDQRTIPASLVIELTRQTQAWQEYAFSHASGNKAEILSANGVNNGAAFSYAPTLPSLTTLRNGLVGTWNRGMHWFTTQLNKKAG
jgi:glycosyltransferase involved in cell wall biosynthesis